MVNRINSPNIDWESQRVLSQIAGQISKPLTEIQRLIQHIQCKTRNSDLETNRLTGIVLESSEQIGSLIENIMQLEANKRIEVVIHDTFKFPTLYRFEPSPKPNQGFLPGSRTAVARQRISKMDLEWFLQLEATILEHIDFYGLSIPWLADQLAVSERQIFRKVEKHTGLTPNKYIRTLKLHQAKHLLESYSCSTISEVAAAVGLRDPYYFSKLFYKEFGVKPKDFFK